MIRINLLPTKRKKAAAVPRPLIIGAIAFVLCLIVLAAFSVYVTKQISAMKTDISAKELQLAKLKTKLKEVENYEKNNQEVRDKTKVIEQLKKNQIIPLILLDEVSEMLPKGVWLTNMTDKSSIVSIEGYAFSNTDLVSYVQNLKGSKHLDDVNLIESRQAEIEKISVYKFKLTFKVKV